MNYNDQIEETMMFNLTIRLRLILTMAVMGCLLVIVAVLGIVGGDRSNGVINDIFTNQLHPLLPSARAKLMPCAQEPRLTGW